MVFCKRIELSITDRESYGLIYLPSSDLENRNHCLHVALIGCGWGRRGERAGGEGGLAGSTERNFGKRCAAVAIKP